MSKNTLCEPTKRKDAEIIVKWNFGLGWVFGASDIELYPGVAVFANRRGYRYLADYFRWLADRTISEIAVDPGDHVHLTPRSSCSDEIDFKLDTLTPSNREKVLRNANANKRSRRTGTPIKQFAVIVHEIIESCHDFLKNDDDFRQKTVAEIEELIKVLETKRRELKSM